MRDFYVEGGTGDRKVDELEKATSFSFFTPLGDIFNLYRIIYIVFRLLLEIIPSREKRWKNRNSSYKSGIYKRALISGGSHYQISMLPLCLSPLFVLFPRLSRRDVTKYVSHSLPKPIHVRGEDNNL